MDHEEDDFQSQSFQLAAEENINFSPDLHSYTLPKFDLDDNLQVHLRFDSLVGSEVLLGIQGQEENQWVGEFSRESSGLEFSSGAAESCSISRCNNVWSEATSSESVDLLLKSVGEDEIVMGRTIIKDSDVSDGMDSLTNQMKPNPEQDGSVQSETGTSVNVGFTLPPDKCFANFSGVVSNAIDQVPQFDATCQTNTGKKSENWSSQDLVPCSVAETHNKEVTERSLVTENAPLQAGQLGQDYGEKLENHKVLTEELQINIQSCETSLLELGANNVGNSSSLALNVDPTVQITEVSIEDAYTQNSVPISKSVPIGDRFIGNAEEKVLEGDNCSISHSSDGESSAKTVSHQVEIPQVEQIKGDGDLEFSVQQENLVEDNGCFVDGKSISGTETLYVKEKTASLDQGIQRSDAHVGIATEATTDNGDGLKFHSVKRPSSIQAKSMQMFVPSSAEFGPSNDNINHPYDSSLGNQKETTNSVSVETEHDSHLMDKRASGDSLSPHCADSCMEEAHQAESGQRSDQTLTEIVQSNVQDGQRSDQTLTEIVQSNVQDNHRDVSALNKENGIVNSPIDSINMETKNDSLMMDNMASGDGLGLHNADSCTPVHTTSGLAESLQRSDQNLTEIVSSKVDIDASALGKDKKNNRASSESLNVEIRSDDSLMMDKRITGDGLGVNSAEFNMEVHISSPIQESEQKNGTSLTETEPTKVQISHLDPSDNEKEKETKTRLTDSLNTESTSEGPFMMGERVSSDGFGVHSANCYVQAHISAPIKVMSMQKFNPSLTDIGTSGGHVSPPDVSALESENETKGSTDDLNNVESEMAGSVMPYEGSNPPVTGQYTVTTAYSVHESSYEAVGNIPESTAVFSEDMSLASDNDHYLLLRTNIAKVEAVEGKDAESPLRVEDSSILVVKKEEKVTKISVEPGFSVAKESSQMSNELTSCKDFGEGSVCDHAGFKNLGASFSPELVTKSSQGEPLSPMAELSTPDCFKEEECSVMMDVCMNENEGSEICDNYEGASTTVPGVPVSGCEPSFSHKVLVKGDAEVHPMEVGSSSPIYEPNCGSPTIISCCEGSQNGKEYQEGGTGSLDQIAPYSDGLEREAEIRFCAADLKESDTSGDDKSFTFKVCPRPNLSEKEAARGWKAFPLVQPYEPQTSDKEAVDESFKGDAEDKTKPVVEEPSRGMPLEDVLPESEIKLQEAVGGSLSTIVCDDAAKTHDCKEDNASQLDRRVSLDSSLPSDLTGGKNCNNFKPFSSVPHCEFPQTLEVSSSTTCSLLHVDSNVVENSGDFSQTSGAKNACRSSMGSSQEKTRALSSKVDQKENGKERQVSREAIPAMLTKERGSNLLSASLRSPRVVSQIVGEEEMPPVGYSERGSIKACAVPSVSTSNLLSTSPSSSALFQQPFTDFQQMQLRAQIFVYGSLIQGTAPDEACMVAAFGESGGGRSSWENVWRVAVEKLRNQKSPIHKPETPPFFHSGGKVLEQGARWSVYQSEADCTPRRAGSKGPSSAIINTNMPLSSPLWTCHDGLPLSSNPVGPLVDFQKPLLPIQSYQSPQGRHFVASTSPWLSQPPPGTWYVTPQTVATAGGQSPALPISETVHVTSVRESSGTLPLRVQNASPTPSSFVHNGGSSNPEATGLFMEAKRKIISPNNHSSPETKRRKRKKSLASEELGQIASLVQSQMHPGSVTHHSSTAFPITNPITSASQVFSSSCMPASLPLSSSNYQISGVRDADKRIAFSEEMSSRTEQAKRQAEEAAMHAASAARHSQSLWSQLANQKSSGVASDIEAKLASLAVAIAAAASVAKAAAAAAKVASDAALQAKLMADEALISSNPAELTTETSIDDSVKKIGSVTSASILKGIDRIENPDLVLVAAREAARKRVETASAAAKRAENLDAVLKAAQMAAEAVSQAGTIIAMGEPIPLTLSELVHAGPENYWKVKQTSSDHHIKSSHINSDQTDTGDVKGLDTYAPREPKPCQNQQKVLHSEELSKNSVANQMVLVNGMQLDSLTRSYKEPGAQKDIVSETQMWSTNAPILMQNEGYKGHQRVRTSNDDNIKEGALVEVLSNDGGLRKVWLLAKVMNLKDGEAYVCYTEHVPDQGSVQPMEWVTLVSKGDTPPRIRTPHPMSVAKIERTKKRSRAARGDYTWSVGDKVDALIHNGWREGIITAKSKEDETNLTVFYPDLGESSIVKAWDLRPSLIWKDGQWTEWCCSLENNSYSCEGETLQEKPMKKSRHEIVVNPNGGDTGKDKTLNVVLEEARIPEPSLPLTLSSKEKIFTVGKSMKGDNRCDEPKAKRTGPPKGGPGVIFGVPKPGKKRKFMDVSKHYVAGKDSKVSTGNDSIKVADFLIPQDSASRGWKTTSKNVLKGKSSTDSRPKVINAGKTPRLACRNLPEKESTSNPVFSEQKHGVAQDPLLASKFSARHDGNMLQKPSQVVGSLPNSSRTVDGAPLCSSLDVASDALSSRKASSSVALDFKGKGKAAPSGVKLNANDKKGANLNDNPGQLLPNAVEPRRSSRKIQPTSRMLEGLQSSFTISKAPFVSHDKGIKAQQRGSFSKG